jgi:hypothetical protein
MAVDMTREISRARAGALAWATLLTVSALMGCHKETRAAAETSAVSSGLGANSDTVAQASQPVAAKHFDAAQFELNIASDGNYKAGQAGDVLITVQAKPPYHCNDQYPYKLKLDTAPGVKFASDVVGKDAVKVQGPHAIMTVGLTPETAGKKTIGGQFQFSVCSASNCMVERRNLKLDIDVKQ